MGNFCIYSSYSTSLPPNSNQFDLPPEGFMSSFQITKIHNTLIRRDSNDKISQGLMQSMECVLTREWNSNRIQWKTERIQKFKRLQEVLLDQLKSLRAKPQILEKINCRRRGIKLVLCIYLCLTFFMQRNVFFAYQAGQYCLKTLESSYWKKKAKREEWKRVFSVLYYLMGRMTSTGKGCDSDDHKAVELYLKCMEMSQDGTMLKVWNDMAIIRLACMFLHGCGCRKNPQMAWTLATYCIQHQCIYAPRAMTLLGNILHDGRHPPTMSKDEAFSRAVKYYEESASLGCKYALFNLASMYEEGSVIGQDFRKSLHLYERAARMGHNTSAANMKRLMRKMKMSTVLGNV